MSSNLLANEGAVSWAASVNNAISANQLNGFRITISNGTPVPTSDVTAATTVYLTPYVGNRICLYDGSANWAEYSSAQISASLSGLAANTNFDVFLYDNAGTLTLDLVAWSGANTRATALVQQDGVWVKSGSTTRRYVGTFRTTGTTGQCEDSAAKRYVWNMDNRVLRGTKQADGTFSWTYASTSYAAMNSGNANWKHEFVVGRQEDTMYVALYCLGQGPSGDASNVALGYDSSTSQYAVAGTAQTTNITPIQSATAETIPTDGYHFFQGIHNTSLGGTGTFYGGVYAALLTTSRR